jgi:hypothetical protein
MRRIVLSLIAAAAVLSVSATTVLGTSGAHFFKATASISDTGALVVTFDEAGVGQQQVNYTVTADASATYACINGGGNHPKAANKATFNGPVSSPTVGFQPENGRVKGSISVGPLGSGNFSCPSGQTLVLASVSYSNITLTDVTNGVTATIGSVSKTLVNV